MIIASDDPYLTPYALEAATLTRAAREVKRLVGHPREAEIERAQGLLDAFTRHEAPTDHLRLYGASAIKFAADALSIAREWDDIRANRA